MADFRQIKAWKHPETGVIYAQVLHGPGFTHKFSGVLPFKGETPDSLPRLEDVVSELEAQGYKERNRKNGLENDLTVGFGPATPADTWQRFDAERAQKAGSEATEAAGTGNTEQEGTEQPKRSEKPAGGATDSFNRSIRF